MKIVCPSCQAQYEVPELVLTSRRKMRCARCGSEWVPGDAGAPAPPRAAEMVEPEPAPAPDVVAVAAPLPVAEESLGHEDDLATMAAPDLSWDEPEPEPEPELQAEAEPVAPPPRPLALRPETPVTLRDPAALVVPPVRKGPPVVEWVVSLALVAGLVAAALVFRAPIMKAWPPSGRVYAVLGLR